MSSCKFTGIPPPGMAADIKVHYILLLHRADVTQPEQLSAVAILGFFTVGLYYVVALSLASFLQILRSRRLFRLRSSCIISAQNRKRSIAYARFFANRRWHSWAPWHFPTEFPRGFPEVPQSIHAVVRLCQPNFNLVPRFSLLALRRFVPAAYNFYISLALGTPVLDNKSLSTG